MPIERQSGEVRSDRYAEFCRLAERNGIESLLMAIGSSRPDPTVLSAALAATGSRMKFMVACRAGLISPAYFVQQINTLGSLTGGRVHVNIVLGHTPHELRYYGDFLTHDERIQRTDEFLSICRDYWTGGGAVDFEGEHYRVQAGRVRTPFTPFGPSRPEIYIGGSSESVARLATKHADCLWRFPDTLDNIGKVATSLEGKSLGLLLSLITRPTAKEAWDAAHALLRNRSDEAAATQRQFRERSDSVGFRAVYDLAASTQAAATLESPPENPAAPCLWAGAVPYLGSPSIALVGSFEEIRDALFVYRSVGVSQFLFMGWPDEAEVEYFGQGVLPLVRAREAALEQIA
jgi:alkanesulfonate monooxygenase